MTLWGARDNDAKIAKRLGVEITAGKNELLRE